MVKVDASAMATNARLARALTDPRADPERHYREGAPGPQQRHQGSPRSRQGGNAEEPDQRAGASTTPMVAIMPLSSCSRMWQWNTKRPSFGPSNWIITKTRDPGGSG